MNTNTFSDFVLFMLVLFSITPLLITCIWFFKTKKRGYSWIETWKTEMYNSDISHARRGMYTAGYNMKDIDEELPKENNYPQKHQKG